MQPIHEMMIMMKAIKGISNMHVLRHECQTCYETYDLAVGPTYLND
jgi:hypothetical protein